MGLYIHGAYGASKHEMSRTVALGAAAGSTLLAGESGIYVPDIASIGNHLEVHSAIGNCMDLLRELDAPGEGLGPIGAYVTPGAASGSIEFLDAIASVPESSVAVIYTLTWNGIPASTLFLNTAVKRYTEVWLEEYSKLN